MIVIGIAGGSGSGKSTFARYLTHNLHDADIDVIKHDNYYKPLDHLALADRAQVNFDHPDALDTLLMIEHLQALRRGEPIEVPDYDFKNHTRMKTSHLIKPPTVLIVEGILIFADPQLRECFDVKVFIDTDDDDRLIRRIKRDIQDRGRDLESVFTQYQRTVKPMHLKFVQPSRRWADIIIPRGGWNKIGLDLLSRKLHMHLNVSYPETLHDFIDSASDYDHIYPDH